MTTEHDKILIIDFLAAEVDDEDLVVLGRHGTMS
jgi:hypothetical protein